MVQIGEDANGVPVFKQDSVNGVLLFDTFQSIEGIGLPSGTAGDTTAFFGVDIQGFEQIELRLSDGDVTRSITGNDNFTVRESGVGVNGNPGQQLQINGGAGNDTITLNKIGGPTNVYGGAGNDTLLVGDNATLAGIGSRVFFDGDAHIDETVKNVLASNPDFASLLANAPKVYVNTAPVGGVPALAQLGPIVFAQGGIIWANVVVISPTGVIVEDFVQETSPIRLLDSTVGGTGPFPVYFNNEGQKTTQVTPNKATFPVNRVVAVPVERVVDLRVDVAGTDTLVLDNSAIGTGVTGSLETYSRAVDVFAGGQPVVHGADKFPVTPNPGAPLNLVIRNVPTIADIRIQVIVNGVTSGLLASQYSYNVATHTLTINQGVITANAIVEVTYLAYFQDGVKEQKYYFGGEPVLDPFTKLPLTYTGTEPMLDLFTKAPIKDIYGNQIFHAAGAPQLHYTGDRVTQFAGDIVRYLGGEQVLDEAGQPVFTGTTPFLHLAGQAYIHNRTDRIFTTLATRPTFQLAALTAGTQLDIPVATHNLAAEDKVIVTVYRGTDIYNLPASEFTVDAGAGNRVTLNPSAANQFAGAVKVVVTIAEPAFRAAGELKFYNGSEQVVIGQPVLALNGSNWDFVLNADGSMKTYTATTVVNPYLLEAVAPGSNTAVVTVVNDATKTIVLGGAPVAGQWSVTLRNTTYTTSANVSLNTAALGARGSARQRQRLHRHGQRLDDHRHACRGAGLPRPWRAGLYPGRPRQVQAGHLSRRQE